MTTIAATLPTPLAAPRRFDFGKFFAYAMLIVGSAIFLIPFSWMISGSLKTEANAQSSKVDLLPIPAIPQWQNYSESLQKMDFANCLANTVVITAFVVLGQVISCSLVGFGFAKFSFRGKPGLFIVMIATMMLPAQVTMIPVFILFRSLGWIDTFLPLVLPAWLASPFFVFMFRQFFAAIPDELLEAARLDGASNWAIYSRLMLPLSGPVIAIVAVQSFISTWNDFMGPLIYLNSPENRTIALALNSFKGQYGVTNANLLMAATAVTMLPCILLFFASQKHFVESVAMSGLKA